MRHITCKHIILTVKIYLLAIFVFTVFRFILFITGFSFITAKDSFINILYAFWMGLRFDIVITGYCFLPIFVAYYADELLRYRQYDLTNYIENYKKTADEMKNYAKINFQLTQYIISRRKQSCE